MIRKYDKTHKTLSLICATVIATLLLSVTLTAVSNAFRGLVYEIFFGRFSWEDLLGELAIFLVPLYALSYSGILFALIFRKKNVLSAIAFGIPLVCTFLAVPLLCLGSRDVVDIVLQALEAWSFLIPPALFCVAIMISCFTKGKLFGEKAGFVLLILAFFAWLTLVTLPVTATFVDSILMSIRYAEELSVEELLRDCLRGVYSIPTVLVPASIFPLIGFAFFLPDKEPAEEAAETEEVQQ